MPVIAEIGVIEIAVLFSRLNAPVVAFVKPSSWPVLTFYRF